MHKSLPLLLLVWLVKGFFIFFSHLESPRANELPLCNPVDGKDFPNLKGQPALVSLKGPNNSSFLLCASHVKNIDNSKMIDSYILFSISPNNKNPNIILQGMGSIEDTKVYQKSGNSLFLDSFDQHEDRIIPIWRTTFSCTKTQCNTVDTCIPNTKFKNFQESVERAQTFFESKSRAEFHKIYDPEWKLLFEVAMSAFSGNKKAALLLRNLSKDSRRDGELSLAIRTYNQELDKLQKMGCIPNSR